MQALKTFWIFSLILAGAFVWQVSADPEPKPEPAKVHRSVYNNEPAKPRFRTVPLPIEHDDDEAVAELRQAVEDNANGNDEESSVNVSPKGDASSGRLFMKKFLLFKNMFSANNQQPSVIPIIITGAGNTGNTATASPTQTITTTGTVPTATGTITTQPVTNQRSDSEEEDNEAAEPQAVNVQALQAALAANAQQYVVTDQEIKGTLDSKSTKQPQSVSLRPQGGKGQYIRVRIPQQYRRYFKNGQKVMLNTNNRGGNRRVIKKRVNKNRRRVNRINRNR